jgi:hypothetical protein
VLDPADPCVPAVSFKCTEGNGRLDYDCGPDLEPGIAGVDDDNNGVIDDITEFGAASSDDGVSEDANGDGRLNTPPFPVTLYGHGLTMGSIEVIGFVSAMNRFGTALISMDAFGHGPMGAFAKLDREIKNLLVGMGVDMNEVCTNAPLSPNCQVVLDFTGIIGVDLNGDGVIDDNDIAGKSIEGIVEDFFSVGFMKIISKDGRGYDLDGDGYLDSGRISFNANILQTRDILRQTAVDYMQLARIVDNFGTWTAQDFNGDGTADLAGDFNADGQYDMGGPTDVNTRGHFYMGSSLGGINGSIGLAVNPRMVVGAPVSGGGGMVDIIIRGSDRAATDPVFSQVAGTIVVGDYDGIDGRATLTFNNDNPSQAFGFIDLPDFGRVQVTNLVNGESNIVTGKCEDPADVSCAAGSAVNFSIGIPADVGDVIEVRSLDNPPGSGQSVFYALARYHGFGVHRNTPDFRRYLGMGQMIIEKSDPATLSRNYFINDRGGPLPGHPEKAALIINTPGDQNVPLNTGNAIATGAGLWTMDQAQPILDNGLNIGFVPAEGYTKRAQHRLRARRRIHQTHLRPRRYRRRRPRMRLPRRRPQVPTRRPGAHPAGQGPELRPDQRRALALRQRRGPPRLRPARNQKPRHRMGNVHGQPDRILLPERRHMHHRRPPRAPRSAHDPSRARRSARQLDNGRRHRPHQRPSPLDPRSKPLRLSLPHHRRNRDRAELCY